jgi:hypothetical protein
MMFDPGVAPAVVLWRLKEKSDVGIMQFKNNVKHYLVLALHISRLFLSICIQEKSDVEQ